MNKRGNQVRTEDRRARRKKSTFRKHKKSVLMICAVLVCLSAVLAVGSVKLHAKNEKYKIQEKELAQQIEEQKERAKEVKEFEEYVKTDDYIKETAEEKLDLVDPNEIIFKPVK